MRATAMLRSIAANSLSRSPVVAAKKTLEITSAALRVNKGLALISFPMRWVEGHISHSRWVLWRCHPQQPSCSRKFGCRLFLKHTHWAVCLRHMKTLTIWQNQEFSRQNQKKSFVTTNFCYASCIRIKIFKVNKFRQRLICSSIVAEGFHFQFFFSILQSLSFVVKDNSFLSSKLITVQLRACRSLYDKWLTTVSHSFVYQDDFASFLAGTNFVGDTSEDLSASAKFDSRSGEKNDHVFSYTSFVLYPLRARFTTK